MTAMDRILHRAPLPLLAGGALLAAAGAGAQVVAIDVPGALLQALGATTAFGAAMKVAGPLAIAGLVLTGLRALREPEATAAAPAASDPAPSHDQTAEDDDLLAAPTARAMAEWQRRLAEKVAAEAGAEAEAAPAPRRRSIGAVLHRAALVLVGAAFVGLLGVTLWNTYAAPIVAGGAAPAAEAAAPAGQTAADRIAAMLDRAPAPAAPAADADGLALPSLPDVDISAVTDRIADIQAQVQTLAEAAIAGDQDAMMTLGMLIGAVIGGAFMLALLLKVLIRLRSGGARRARTHARRSRLDTLSPAAR